MARAPLPDKAGFSQTRVAGLEVEQPLLAARVFSLLLRRNVLLRDPIATK
jgi:hypothetical protein